MAQALPFGEVFGFDVADRSDEARRHRSQRLCPFQGPNARCTKAGKNNPLGICSYADEHRAVTVCPIRFLEGRRIVEDVARLAFGAGATAIACPEIHILRKTNGKRVGKVDYVVVKLDAKNQPIEFAALEVQAVYKSGKSVRAAFNHYLKTEDLLPGGLQRPDYRSSAQKRLMPQLILKLPVFRRWGTKFFVAVDASFYESLPPMKQEDSLANSEVTWLVYPFARRPAKIGFEIGKPKVIFTTMAEVETALREGKPPNPSEVLDECRQKIEFSERVNRPLPRIKT